MTRTGSLAPPARAGARRRRGDRRSSARSSPHDSAHLHVAGDGNVHRRHCRSRAARCTPPWARVPFAHGRIRSLDLDAVRAAPGVVAVITAADIPGVNDVGPIQHDDPILADGVVQFVGQPVFAVAARHRECRAQGGEARALRPRAAAGDPHHRRGDRRANRGCCRPRTSRAATRQPRSRARRTASPGRCASGGQDHFYLEGQIALAVPQEHGGMRIYCSTQHPGEVQQMVAHALGDRRPRRRRRMPADGRRLRRQGNADVAVRLPRGDRSRGRPGARSSSASTATTT